MPSLMASLYIFQIKTCHKNYYAHVKLVIKTNVLWRFLYAKPLKLTKIAINGLTDIVIPI